MEQVIPACYDKVHVANYVTKYQSFVLQGLVYNNNNNTNITKTQAFVYRDTTNV